GGRGDLEHLPVVAIARHETTGTGSPGGPTLQALTEVRIGHAVPTFAILAVRHLVNGDVAWPKTGILRVHTQPNQRLGCGSRDRPLERVLGELTAAVQVRVGDLDAGARNRDVVRLGQPTGENRCSVAGEVNPQVRALGRGARLDVP